MLVKKPMEKGAGREAGSEEPGSKEPSPSRQHCTCARPPCTTQTTLLSGVAVISCLYLGVKTNDLQARSLALESAKGAPSVPLLLEKVDQLKVIVQERLDWSDSCLAQESYKHMAKLRITRETPSECNCPAVKAFDEKTKRGRLTLCVSS